MSDLEPHQPVAAQPTPDSAAQSLAAPQSDHGPAGKSGGSTAAEPAPEAPTVSAEDFPLAIEAALLTSDRPLPASRLSEVLGGVGTKAVTAAIEQLNQGYEQTQRSFRIETVANGFQVLTLPRFAPVLAALHRSRTQTRLTPAGLETLAIIAYKQPILRADVEAIRGVASGEVLRSLMERKLVKIVGRAEVLGRPMLYGTTKTFLEVFGLASLKDLPKAEELRPKGPA